MKPFIQGVKESSQFIYGIVRTGFYVGLFIAGLALPIGGAYLLLSFIEKQL